jgi:hypothetical protein
VFAIPAKTWSKLLSQFNQVTAKMAVAMGLSDGQEILEFDAKDPMTQSQNLESLFAANRRTELSAALRTARIEARRNQEKYAKLALPVQVQ